MRVFVDGAVGTTGLDIEARLADRPEFSLIKLNDAHRKDVSARTEALNAADVAILCLPDDAARAAVAMIENATTRVIDASSAHRVADAWTYGFPELGFDVASAMRVSNPGCYPTGFLALVVPLLRAGLIPRDWPLSVHAVSGYSGGGKALIARFDQEADLAYRSYGFALPHKHVAEMQRHAGLHYAPIFSPSVARAYRGMLVEVPMALAAMPTRPTRAALLASLTAFYRDSRVVCVHEGQPDEVLMTVQATATDRLDLFIVGDAGDTQARLVAVLDNLGKGASGAALQSLNLMAGLPGDRGLRLD